MYGRLHYLPLLLLFPVSAFACLNDRDSDKLINEGRRLPDVVRVTTGRFERNPPLFYQMRIERETKEIAVHPDHLSLYDDVAVAYDRLGNDDAAIDWIERKHRRLHGDPKVGPQHEDWYRYYANVGTFHAHHWLRSGQLSSGPLGEMEQARDAIAKAIEIKPDAHFGREKYQLLALEWIIAKRQKPEDTGELEGYLTEKLGISFFPESDAKQKQEVDKAITGLMGLVVLGNAWESIDIFATLAKLVDWRREQKLAHFADLRQIELLKAGKNFLFPNTAVSTNRYIDHLYNARPFATNIGNVEEKFTELRAEAESWQQARTAYMLVRLKAGRHPDTDSTFWKDYHPVPAPSLEIPESKEWRGNFMNWMLYHTSWGIPVLLLVIYVLPAGLVVYGIRQLYKAFQRQRLLR